MEINSHPHAVSTSTVGGIFQDDASMKKTMPADAAIADLETCTIGFLF